MTTLGFFWNDIRLAVRALATRPALLAAAVASIAIGAGVNMSAYSVLRHVMFDSAVTAAAPDRLARIAPGISFPNYQDLRAQDLPVDLAAMQMSTLTCRWHTTASMVSAHVVSDNFFDIVGIRPILGRTFRTGEGHRDLAVITEGLWQRLGGDPAIVGRSIQLNGWPYEIAGVLPQGFAATAVATGALYVPVSARVAVALDNRRAAQFDLFGRLHDGVALDQVAPALRVAAARIEARSSDVDKGFARGLTASPMDAFSFLRQLPEGRLVLAVAATMYSLVGLVLIVACANVAGLLISRTDERRHELAVRIALGATRVQLARQWLAESLVISSLGGLAAVILWTLTASWMKTLVMTPTAAEITVLPSSPPLGYCLLLVILMTIGCGAGSVVCIGQTSGLPGLQMRRTGRLLGWMSLQRAVVAAQMAICCVLLTADALLVLNLLRLHRADVGFDVPHLAEIEMRFPTSARPVDASVVMDALRALPGVLAVSSGSPIGPPFTERVQSDDSPGQVNVNVDVRPVGPRFFEAIGAPIVLGRDVIDQDLRVGSAQPVVVNETFVRRYLLAGDVDPIGRRFLRPPNAEVGRGPTVLQIVGVARDSLARTIGDGHVPVVYVPQRLPSLIVRTAGSAASAVRLLEQTIERVEPAGTVVMAVPMEESLAAALMPLRVATLGLGILGSVGCALGMTGLFVVVSRAAARRTYEIAVRVAVGASHAAIVGLIIRDAMRTVALGGSVGVVLAFVIARVVQAAITTQSLADPVAFALAAAVLLALGIGASLQPALRASHTSPINALRSE